MDFVYVKMLFQTRKPGVGEAIDSDFLDFRLNKTLTQHLKKQITH